jgi:paraquat-inducible protein B
MSTLRSETTATESKLRADLDNALDQLNKEQTLHTETSSLYDNTRESLERTEELLKNVKFELAKVNELLIILRIY